MAIPEWDGDFQKVLRAYLNLLEDSAALPADAYLSSLGLSPLKSIQLVLDIEEAYRISVPDELLSEMFETAGTLWKTVQSLRARQRGEA